MRGLIALCLIIPIMIAGCKATQGPVEQTDAVPDYIVGIWESEDKEIAIKIEKGGEISKMRHYLIGEVNIDEGGKQISGIENSNAIFVLGDTNLQYDESMQTLEVFIEVAYFKLEMPIGTLEGESRDYFKGKISDNGQIWNTDWRNWSWLKGSDRIKESEVPWVSKKFIKKSSKEMRPVSNHK